MSDGFKLYMTQGQGGVFAEEVQTLEEALEYVREYQEDGSWGIQYPDGTWYNWNKNEVVKE